MIRIMIAKTSISESRVYYYCSTTVMAVVIKALLYEIKSWISPSTCFFITIITANDEEQENILVV